MTTSNKLITQDKLFKLIERVLPESMSLVDVLSDLLEVSNDSSYRRIRGETALTIEEVSKICSHFNVSFDSICNIDNLDSVTFAYSGLTSEADYIIYLESIRDDMKKIAAADQKLIYYAAEDIPLFHNFKLPGLAAFKIFYWLHSIINAEKYVNVKFNRNVFSHEIKAICEEIYNLYANIPSVEIWSDLTASSLLMQIDYIWQSGIFENKDEALHICDLTAENFRCFEEQAEKSIKFNFNNQPVLQENSFQLYHSGIEIGNNTILVNIQGNNVLYLTHNTLNKIKTMNNPFCQETEKWIKNLIKKSTLISGVDQRSRYQFFRKINTDLEDLKKRIIES